MSDTSVERNIERLENGLYQIQSFTNPDISYVVDLLERTCTCPHFRYRGAYCKHLKAVDEEVGDDDWLERDENWDRVPPFASF